MILQGKIAVITGAGSGMGLAIATRFAVEGASLVVGDWNGERLEAAVTRIKESGGTIIGARGNIADQATAEHLIDLALSAYGRLDVLCNNAGVMDYMQGVDDSPLLRRLDNPRCNWLPTYILPEVRYSMQQGRLNGWSQLWLLVCQGA